MRQFLIEPDGTIVVDQTAAEILVETLQDVGADVVTLRSPHLPAGVYVGWVDDWGVTKGLPVNMKAWALYGRSPIHGPMVVRRDDGLDIPDEYVEHLARPIEEWLDAEILDRMYEILRTPPENVSLPPHIVETIREARRHPERLVRREPPAVDDSGAPS